MDSADAGVAFIALFIFIIGGYWVLRGIGQLFERYNPILVILYLFLLCPVAIFHALLLGIFGKSKKERLKKIVENEVEFQLRVQKETERRLR